MDFYAKLRALKEKYDQINEKLSDPDIMSNQEKYVKLSKERSELEEIVKAFNKYDEILNNLNGNKEIISKNEDRELVEMAQAELEELEEAKEKFEDEIKFLLIPKDPNDNRNVIVEIRAGTGGDEAGIFANDLFRMYSRFAEKKGWKQELIELTEATLGGVKEVVFSLTGENLYGEMKFENGVHRVQRVPLTEANGRVHTSAASVVVMPEIEEVDEEINIPSNEIRMDVFRSGGAGGQNVNKVETAIRIIHIPTGLVVQCQDERSQLKNKLKAMKVLKTRLYDMKLQQHNSEIAAQRKSIVKTGDRSDKVRTYNYPQNRVTDHRIGLTLYNLSNIMEGDIFELIDKLKFADRTERLNETI